MKLCATKYCRNKPIKGRPLCAKCRSRKYAREHPFRYHYNAQKQNAKRRGHPFSLSFKEYKAVWQQHPEKWKEKLNPGTCRWHMDRKDARLGYEKGSVQILDKTRNVEKYHTHDKFILDVAWRHKKSEPTKKAPF